MTDHTGNALDRITVSRLVEALVAERGLTRPELIRMDPDALAALRAEAIAAADRLPVPMDAPGYLFHGTARSRLSAIREQGLVPQDRSRWSTTAFIGEHGVGRVCLTCRVHRAEFYARAAAPKSPALLRVHEADVAGPQPDPKEADDCVFTETGIPPAALEVWSRKRWRPLATGAGA